MARIMVALPPAADVGQRGKLRWRKPGTVANEFFTEEPTEADDQDPVIIRALAKGALILITAARPTKHSDRKE